MSVRHRLFEEESENLPLAHMGQGGCGETILYVPHCNRSARNLVWTSVRSSSAPRGILAGPESRVPVPSQCPEQAKSAPLLFLSCTTAAVLGAVSSLVAFGARVWKVGLFGISRKCNGPWIPTLTAQPKLEAPAAWSQCEFVLSRAVACVPAVCQLGRAACLCCLPVCMDRSVAGF